MQPISEIVSLALLFLKCISCLEENPSLLITQDCLSLVVHAFILIRLSEKKTCKKDDIVWRKTITAALIPLISLFSKMIHSEREDVTPNRRLIRKHLREGDILKDVIMWPGHTKEGNPTMIHRVFREYFLVLVKRAKPTHCPWVRHIKARHRNGS